jgi:hypothetical protein
MGDLLDKEHGKDEEEEEEEEREGRAAGCIARW